MSEVICHFCFKPVIILSVRKTMTYLGEIRSWCCEDCAEKESSPAEVLRICASYLSSLVEREGFAGFHI